MKDFNSIGKIFLEEANNEIVAYENNYKIAIIYFSKDLFVLQNETKNLKDFINLAEKDIEKYLQYLKINSWWKINPIEEIKNSRIFEKYKQVFKLCLDLEKLNLNFLWDNNFLIENFKKCSKRLWLEKTKEIYSNQYYIIKSIVDYFLFSKNSKTEKEFKEVIEFALLQQK